PVLDPEVRNSHAQEFVGRVAVEVHRGGVYLEKFERCRIEDVHRLRALLELRKAVVPEIEGAGRRGWLRRLRSGSRQRDFKFARRNDQFTAGHAFVVAHTTVRRYWNIHSRANTQMKSE